MTTLLLIGLLGAWQQLPGPAGANCRSIAVKPDDDRVVLCCTWDGSRGGLYRSTDSGRSWNPVQGIDREHGRGMNSVRFCPIDPMVAVCGTKIVGSNGQYLSTDAGQTWASTGYAGGYTEAVAWPPGARDTFYVLSGLGLERTTDLGRSWNQVFGRTMCWQVGFRPDAPGTMFIGGLNGFYRSFDRGITWDTTRFGRRCYDFSFDPAAPDTMYLAAHTYGVFKAWDGGDAFESLGNADRYNTSIVLGPARQEIWTGGFAAFPVPGRISVSPDLGRSWREFGPGRLFDAVCHDLALGDTLFLAAGEYFGPQRWSRTDSTWHPGAAGMREANVRAVATGPGTIYVAGSVIGVSRSTDRGLTWSGSPGSRVSGRVHNTEMLPPGLVCSQTNPDTVYACFEGQQPYLDSVFFSPDAGAGWVGYHVPGLRADDRLRVLALHPRGSETLYLVSTRGVHKSTDAARTWALVDDEASYCVTVDPHAPGTVYSGGLGCVRRSTDAGGSWHDFSSGLPQWSETMNIAADPESVGVLFAAMCGGEARDPGSGVYVLRPGAGGWEKVSSGLPGSFKLRPRVELDAARGWLWCVLPNQGAQVYRSTDRGANWVAADAGLLAHGVYFVHAAERVYLGTRADGAWCLDDPAGIESGAVPLPAAGFHRTVFFSDALQLPEGRHRLLDRSGRLALSGSGGLDTRRLEPGVYFLVLPDRVIKAVKPR